MSTRSTPHDLIVVGAGLAGLVAAVTARELGLSVAVLDPHPAGGRARTTDRGGWSLNQGPHALYERGALAGFLTEHGISLPGGDPTSYPAFGWRQGELHPLPYTASATLRTKLLGLRGKARFARWYGSLRRVDSESLVGTSVSEWVGAEPDDVVDIIEMLVRLTTFVNAPDLLDAGAAVDQLRAGLAGVRYLDGGWQRIVAALLELLGAQGVTVESSEVRSVHVDGPTATVATSSDDLLARSVIVAAGGPAIEARLLGTITADVGDAVEATCLDLLLDRPARRAAAFGIGTPLYLAPHSAVAELAPPGRGLLAGLHYLRPGTGPAEPAAEARALAEMAVALGNPASTEVDRRHLHRITVTHSVPGARRGGLRGRPGVATDVAGVFRAGDWVGPHGFLGDATAASAVAAAKAVAARHARIGV